ncbi:hypothetical protein RHGRI_018267 [Rhododendron griersonianum]|uniref:Uncharacterized protein n=1 Tax=Rhododendron griersonianum TaxID=479676 RepID=A0AAV6K0U6_9ERIC|nr:hypothetical protein RHGRI_018267 [Rhododendron griersonianum]
MLQKFKYIPAVCILLKLVLLIRYLVTTFKIVPRGTEGAMSVEGTVAGLLASILLAFAGFLMGLEGRRNQARVAGGSPVMGDGRRGSPLTGRPPTRVAGDWAVAVDVITGIKVPEALICVVASQIANLGESVIGASLQDKEGFRWLNNDAVNVINISMGKSVKLRLETEKDTMLLKGKDVLLFSCSSFPLIQWDQASEERSPEILQQ